MVKLNEEGVNKAAIALQVFTNEELKYCRVHAHIALTAYLEHVESEVVIPTNKKEFSAMLVKEYGYNKKLADIIASDVAGHGAFTADAVHSPDTKALLTDMRMQVSLTDRATMPIPLYERIKALIGAIPDERKAALQTSMLACDIALENIKLKNTRS